MFVSIYLLIGIGFALLSREIAFAHPIWFVSIVLFWPIGTISMTIETIEGIRELGWTKYWEEFDKND